MTAWPDPLTALAVPAGAPAAAPSETGASIFILLLVAVGSVAAGLFVGGFRRRRARRRDAPAQGAGPPWSTTRAPRPPAAGDRPSDGPWSTAESDGPSLQRRL